MTIADPYADAQENRKTDTARTMRVPAATMLQSAARGVLKKLRKAVDRRPEERVATFDSREQVERELEQPVLATYSPRPEG